MKKQFIFIVLTFAVNINAFCQAIVTIVPKQSTNRYLQSSAGSITFPVKITITYNGSGVVADHPVAFTSTNSSNIALVPNSQSLTSNPTSIPYGDFARTPKTKEVIVNVTMNAAQFLSNFELFDIRLVGAPNTDPAHRVIIENIPIGASNEDVTISQVQQTDSIEIAPLENDDKTTEQRMMWLKYKIEGSLQKDSTMEVELWGNTGGSVISELKTKSFTIRKRPAQPLGQIDSVRVHFTINSVKSFGKNEYIYMKLKNQERETVGILTRSKLVNANKAFWIEAGTNFDLLDGIKAKNLYTGVFMYKRDIRPFFHRKKDRKTPFISNNLAIFGGIYESRSIGTETSVTNKIDYRDNTSYLQDSLGNHTIFHDTGSVSKSTIINTLGLFISPQLRLTNGSSNTDGVHLFASFWFELVWQRALTTFDYTKTTNINTSKVPPSNFQSYQQKITEFKQDFRSHYIGLGLPLYLKDGDVNLFFSPVIGRTNQRFGLPTEENEAAKKEFSNSLAPFPNWSFFYLSIFRLSEEKFGIAFTGEVRGLMRHNTKPVISLALSKKFDLTKLLEFK